jgi:hypothetical protein
MSNKIDTKLGRRGFLKGSCGELSEPTCCSRSSRMKLSGE